ELPEETMVRAIETAHAAMQPIIELQQQMVEKLGKPKRTYLGTVSNPELDAEIRSWMGEKLEQAIFNPEKMSREAATEAVKLQAVGEFVLRGYEEKAVAKNVDAIEKETVRNAILDRGYRP